MTQTPRSELVTDVRPGPGSVLGGLPGEVLTPGTDGYAAAAGTVFAAGTPDLIVRPGDPAGVAAAVRYATGAGLALTVRSGGHSVAGLSTHAYGMVIDLRHLSGVQV